MRGIPHFILGFVTFYRYFLARADKLKHGILLAAAAFFFGILAGWCNENSSGGGFLLVMVGIGVTLFSIQVWGQQDQHTPQKGNDAAVNSTDQRFGQDIKACEKHLEGLLKQGGCRGVTVKVYDKLEAYCEGLGNLEKQDAEPLPEEILVNLLATPDGLFRTST